MIIKPDFYDKFKCIGKACSFTCCKDWKIAVDDSTASVWKRTPPPEGMKSRNKNLERFTKFKDGGRVIALEDNVCPFLNDEKLCRLVIAYGDQLLSETCQVFPREKHEFDGRTELTLMPCCPEAVDLLNEASAFKLIRTDSDAGTNEPERDIYKLRALIMDLMSDETHSCQAELLGAFYIMSEVLRKGAIDIESISAAIPELLSTVEEMDLAAEECFDECYELFFDLTENYRKENMYQWILDDMYHASEDLGDDSLYDDAFLERWLSYEPLFHKVLAQEVYADLINEGSEPEDMAIRLQWIALEYALVRHMCYLHFSKEQQLSYEKVREILVLVSRMMGYEEADIYEYLNNSFEDMVWDWGYFALVVGK